MNASKLFGLALVLVAAAAACGGSGNLPLCALPQQPAFTMVQPSPDATNVPDNLGSISFEGTAPSSQLTLAGGTQSVALTLASEGTSGVDYFANIPTLLASTTYTVKYPITTSGSNCESQNYTVTVGSFATQ
jgi:hypothetical protein